MCNKAETHTQVSINAFLKGASSLHFLLLLFLFVSLILPVTHVSAGEHSYVSSVGSCGAKDVEDNLEQAAKEGERLPPKVFSEPVDVGLGLYIEEISDISEINYSFEITAFLETIWCDPRLAFDPGQGVKKYLYLEEMADETLKDIWWPELSFVNVATNPEIQNQELIVYYDGTVVYEEFIHAEVKADLNFSQFPFDEQKLIIDIESFAWPADDLVIHPIRESIGFADHFSIPSWRLDRDVSYEVLKAKEARDRDEFSKFVMGIHAERLRIPNFFRMLLPLIMVVLSSFSVFWLRPLSTGRFGITFTTILTIVAFNLIILKRLPHVPELTYFEALSGFSFTVLLLVVIHNTAVEYLSGQKREATAQRIDRVARVLFPLCYLLGIYAIAVMFDTFD